MHSILRAPLEALGGRPRIAGRRIRVIDIVLWHEKRGLTPDEIVEMVYPSITVADVHAALAYYFDHRDEIEAEFEDEAKQIGEFKQRYPPKLKAKLGEC